MYHRSVHIGGLVALVGLSMAFTGSPVAHAQSTGIEFPIGTTSTVLQVNVIATGYNGGVLPIVFASELKRVYDLGKNQLRGFAVESAPISARSCRSISIALQGSSTILALPFGKSEAFQESLSGCVEIVNAETDKVVGRSYAGLWIMRAAQQHDTSITRQLTISLADLPPNASVIIRLVGSQGIAPDLVNPDHKSQQAFVPSRFAMNTEAQQVH